MLSPEKHVLLFENSNFGTERTDIFIRDQRSKFQNVCGHNSNSIGDHKIIESFYCSIFEDCETFQATGSLSPPTQPIPNLTLPQPPKRTQDGFCPPSKSRPIIHHLPPSLVVCQRLQCTISNRYPQYHSKC